MAVKFNMYRVEAQINWDASHNETVLVRAKSERKAIEEAEKLFKRAGYFAYRIDKVEKIENT